MTPAEIIVLARSLFGEVQPNTVTEEQTREYLSAALREIWSDLPSDNLKPLLTREPISINGGIGDISENWNRIIEVYVDDQPALQVAREVITSADFGDLFAPGFPIYHMDEQKIFVRPANAGNVDIIHVEAPTRITEANEGDVLEEIPKVYHEALAFLTASYMYLQEEDAGQAQAFRAEYTNKITSISQQLAAEG